MINTNVLNIINIRLTKFELYLKVMVKFTLKVGKENFEVEHTSEESYEDFQAKVFAVTDIPPKNLKVLFKAKMIKVIKFIPRTTNLCLPFQMEVLS